jgi:hypothetical protein
MQAADVKWSESIKRIQKRSEIQIGRADLRVRRFSGQAIDSPNE